MLFLKNTLLETMQNHVLNHPDIEACGLLYTCDSLDMPEHCFLMKNIAQSKDFFQFESQEQFDIYKKIDDNNGQVCAVFHSHINSGAFPSATDKAHLANMGMIHQIIFSYETLSKNLSMRSFLITHDMVLEERIKII